MAAATFSAARRSSISCPSRRSLAARYSADSPGNVTPTILLSFIDRATVNDSSLSAGPRERGPASLPGRDLDEPVQEWNPHRGGRHGFQDRGVPARQAGEC